MASLKKYKVRYSKRKTSKGHANGVIADIIGSNGKIVWSTHKGSKEEAKAAVKAAIKSRRKTRRAKRKVKRASKSVLSRLNKAENVLVSMAGSRAAYNEEAAKGANL